MDKNNPIASSSSPVGAPHLPGISVDTEAVVLDDERVFVAPATVDDVKSSRDGLPPASEGEGTSQQQVEPPPSNIVNLALLPAKLRSIMEEFDTDGDGFVSATELAAASKLWFKTHKADSDDMNLSSLPDSVRAALSDFDIDGDGNVSTTELAAAAKLYAKNKVVTRKLKLGLIVSSVVFLVLLALQFVVVYVAIQFAKETQVATNGVMTARSGAVVQLSSSEFLVDSRGALVQRVVQPNRTLTLATTITNAAAGSGGVTGGRSLVGKTAAHAAPAAGGGGVASQGHHHHSLSAALASSGYAEGSPGHRAMQGVWVGRGMESSTSAAISANGTTSSDYYSSSTSSTSSSTNSSNDTTTGTTSSLSFAPPLPPLTTAESIVTAPLSSDLSLDSLSALKWITIQSPTGVVLSLQVQALIVQPPSPATGRNGPATFLTQFGHITCLGTALYYTDDAQTPVFSATGFLPTPASSGSTFLTVAGVQFDGKYPSSSASPMPSPTPSTSLTPSTSHTPSATPTLFNASHYLMIYNLTGANFTYNGGAAGGGGGGRAARALSSTTTSTLPLEHRLVTQNTVATFSALAQTTLESDLAVMRAVEAEGGWPVEAPPPTYSTYTPETPPSPPACNPSDRATLVPFDPFTDGDAYWEDLLHSLCHSNGTMRSAGGGGGGGGAHRTQHLPLWLVDPSIQANSSLGTVSLDVDCWLATFTTAAGSSTPLSSGFVAGGVNVSQGSAVLAAVARRSTKPPLAANANATYTWLWEGNITSISPGSANLGGIAGSVVVALLDNTLLLMPPTPSDNSTTTASTTASTTTTVTFSFAEPATEGSAFGVRATVTATPYNASLGCLQASGPANLTAAFGAHSHEGAGSALYSNCYGQVSWAVKQGHLGGFLEGSYGPLVFPTPTLDLELTRASSASGGNWTGTASCASAALGQSYGLGVELNVRGVQDFSLLLHQPPLPTPPVGETLHITSDALLYTHTSPTCGSAVGGVQGTLSLLGGGGSSSGGNDTTTTTTTDTATAATATAALIPGTGTLMGRVCGPTSQWSVSLSLGSFSLAGQSVLYGQVNASRPHSTLPWGGLTLTASAQLGGVVPATISGAALGPSQGTDSTPSGWAFNATVTLGFVPGVSLVDFTATGPLLHPALTPSATLGADVTTTTTTTTTSAAGGCLTLAAYAPYFGFTLGTQHSLASPGILYFDSCSGVFEATVNTTGPLALGPITLSTGSPLRISLAGSNCSNTCPPSYNASSSSSSSCYYACSPPVLPPSLDPFSAPPTPGVWSLSLSGAGSAGPTISLPHFLATGTSPYNILGAGRLNVSVTQGGVSSQGGGGSMGQTAPTHAFSLNGQGDFVYNASRLTLGECPFTATGTPALNISTYLSSAIGPLVLSGDGGEGRVGAVFNAGVTALSYACSSPGGPSGGWSVTLPLTFMTPAWTYNDTTTTTSQQQYHYFPRAVGLGVGPLNLSYATATLHANHTPLPSQWGASIVASGHWASNPTMLLTATIDLATRVQPFAANLSVDLLVGAVAAAGGASTSLLPLQLFGTLPLTLPTTLSSPSAAASDCFSGAATLNAYLKLASSSSQPTSTASRPTLLLHDPGANVTYNSCSPTPWNVTSRVVSTSLILDGGATLSPSGFTFSGGEGNWSATTQGTLELGGLASCPVSLGVTSLHNTTLALACSPGTLPSFFFNATTASSSSAAAAAGAGAVAAAAPTPVVTLSNDYSTSSSSSSTATAATGNITTVYSSGCLISSAPAAAVHISFPGVFSHNLTGIHWTYYSSSCNQTLGGEYGLGKGVSRWISSKSRLSPFTLGGVRLQSASVQLLGVSESAWLVSGKARAYLAMERATPAAVTFGTLGLGALFGANLSTAVSHPGSFSLGLHLNFGAGQSASCDAVGTTPPLKGYASALTLHFLSPPLTLPDLPATFNPCTSTLVVSGETLPTAVVLGGSALDVTGVHLSFTPGLLGWRGNLSGTWGLEPRAIAFSPASTLDTPPTIALGSHLLPLPSFGLATTSLTTLGDCPDGAYQSGSAVVSVGNLPSNFPAISSAPATLTLACDGSGAFTITAPSLPNFTLPVGGQQHTVSGGSLAIRRGTAPTDYTYTLTGLSTQGFNISLALLPGQPRAKLTASTGDLTASSGSSASAAGGGRRLGKAASVTSLGSKVASLDPNCDFARLPSFDASSKLGDLFTRLVEKATLVGDLALSSLATGLSDAQLAAEEAAQKAIAKVDQEVAAAEAAVQELLAAKEAAQKGVKMTDEEVAAAQEAAREAAVRELLAAGDAATSTTTTTTKYKIKGSKAEKTLASGESITIPLDSSPVQFKKGVAVKEVEGVDVSVEGETLVADAAAAAAGAAGAKSKGVGAIPDLLSGVAEAISASGLAECQSYTAEAGDVWGLSPTMTLTVCPTASAPQPVCTLAFGGFPTDLQPLLDAQADASNALPKELSAILAAMTNPGVSLTPSGLTLTAASFTVPSTDLVLTNVSLLLDPDFSMQGSATTTLLGVPFSVTLRRSSAGVYGLTLCVDTSPLGFPFDLVGCMTYSGSGSGAVGTGSISSLSLPLGGRKLAMGKPGAVSLRGGALLFTGDLPGVSLGGLSLPALSFECGVVPAPPGAKLPPGVTTVMEIKLSSPPMTISALGTATATIAISPATKAFSLSLAASMTSELLTGSFSAMVDFQGGSDSPCTSFGGSFDSLSLALGGDDSLTLPGGVALSFSTCSSALSFSTTTPFAFTLFGTPVAINSLSLSRRDRTSGWEGRLSVSASAPILPATGAISSTQSMEVSFLGSKVTTTRLAFDIAWETLVLRGTMDYTPASSPLCRATPTLTNVGTVYMAASYSLPTDDPTAPPRALSGSASISRQCSGRLLSVSLPLGTPSGASVPGGFKVDLGVTEVTLASPTLQFLMLPTPTLQVTGVIGGGGILVSLPLPLKKGGALAVTASLLQPTSLGGLLDTLSGSSGLLSGGIPGVPELLSPLVNAQVTALAATVTISTVPKVRCLYLAAVVQAFGGTAAVAGQVCLGAAKYGSFGVSLDPNMPSLPPLVKDALSFLDPPSISMGFGTAPMSSTPPALPALPSSSPSSSLKLPRLLPGVKGLTLSGSLPSGNRMSAIAGVLKGVPGLGTFVSSALSSALVSVTFADIKSVRVSLDLGLGSDGLQLAGDCTLAGLSLFSTLKPAAVAGGLAGLLKSKVSSGASVTQVLWSNIEIELEAAPGVITAQLSAGFALEGGSGNWERALGISGLTVTMPIIASIALSITGVPPFIFPTKIAFAGGATFGSASAQQRQVVDFAFSLDIKKPYESGFLFRAENVSPVNLLVDLMPLSPNPLTPVKDILAAIFPPTKVFSMSLNPGLTDLVISSGLITATSIPPGLAMLVEGQRLFGGLMYIEKAWLKVALTSGISLGARLKAVDFLGIIKLQCGSPPCGYEGPSFSLDVNHREFRACLSGGGGMLLPYYADIRPPTPPCQEETRVDYFTAAPPLPSTWTTPHCMPDAPGTSWYIKTGGDPNDRASPWGGANKCCAVNKWDCYWYPSKAACEVGLVEAKCWSCGEGGGAAHVCPPWTKEVYSPNAYSYNANPVGRVVGRSSVVFTVEATNDAHVALYEGGSAAPDQARKWEIVLGGWGNTISVIRDGSGGRELARFNGGVMFGNPWKVVNTPNAYGYSANPVGRVVGIRSVVFAVEASNDAHIALYEDGGGASADQARKWEIVLGGWGNTISVLRDGSQGRELARFTGTVMRSPAPLFWVSWTTTSCTVGRGPEVGRDALMTATRPDALAVSSIAVSTGWGSTGRWRFSFAALPQFWASWTTTTCTVGRGDAVGSDVLMTATRPDALTVTDVAVTTGWGATGKWNVAFVTQGYSVKYQYCPPRPPSSLVLCGHILARFLGSIIPPFPQGGLTFPSIDSCFQADGRFSFGVTTPSSASNYVTMSMTTSGSLLNLATLKVDLDMAIGSELIKVLVDPIIKPYNDLKAFVESVKRKAIEIKDQFQREYDSAQNKVRDELNKVCSAVRPFIGNCGRLLSSLSGNTTAIDTFHPTMLRQLKVPDCYSDCGCGRGRVCADVGPWDNCRYNPCACAPWWLGGGCSCWCVGGARNVCGDPCTPCKDTCDGVMGSYNSAASAISSAWNKLDDAVQKLNRAMDFFNKFDFARPLALNSGSFKVDLSSKVLALSTRLALTVLGKSVDLDFSVGVGSNVGTNTGCPAVSATQVLKDLTGRPAQEVMKLFFKVMRDTRITEVLPYFGLSIPGDYESQFNTLF